MSVVSDRMGVETGIEPFRFRLLEGHRKDLVSRSSLFKVSGHYVLETVDAFESIFEVFGRVILAVSEDIGYFLCVGAESEISEAHVAVEHIALTDDRLTVEASLAPPYDGYVEVEPGLQTEVYAFLKHEVLDVEVCGDAGHYGSG